MIQRIVAGALRMPIVVFAAAVLLIVARASPRTSELDIEAYPNPVPPLVEVITQPPGWSAEETERYVTIPLEIGLSGMPGLDHIRSQSLFGLSDVKCYFNWDTDVQGRAAGGHQPHPVRAAARRASRRSSRRGTRSARSSATASSARATRSRT